MDKDTRIDMLDENKVLKKSSSERLRTILKNIFFTLIAILVFFLGFEFVLALFGVHPILQTEDPLVGFSKNIPLFEEVQQKDGSVILKTAGNKSQHFNRQIFPMKKESETYRIFCMGGSTTYGRPYYDNVSFSGWLRSYLQNADSNRKWEVINAGGISYASYRVVKLMNELKQYTPDLFIVYSGQNEFLEERSYGALLDFPEWVLELNSLLSSTRTYAMVKKGIDTLRFDTQEKTRERYELTGEVDEILNHSVGPTAYHRDEKLQSQIIAHYRLNLQLMVNIAREVGAKIIFVNPAINLKDMSPFKSEHKEGLDEKALVQWQKLYNRALTLHKAENLDEALRVYLEALSIDDRYAELHYKIGQTLFGLKRFDEAQKAFSRASDEDIAPLRILSSMGQIVEDIALQNNVPLVDFPSIIKKAYSREYNHAVFGKEYFVDHVHTTIEGYSLLGLELFDELIRQRIVTVDGIWNEKRIDAIRRQVMAGVDNDTHVKAMMNLVRVLNWTGKSKEAYNVLLKVLAIIGPNADIYRWIGTYMKDQGRYDEAISYYRKAIALNPKDSFASYNLQQILQEQGNADK